jgi:hypothetical protein
VKRVTFNFDYAADPGAVSLSVTIGDGQIGGSSIQLDGKAFGPVGEIVDLPLGDAAELRGHTLLVRTGVIDINKLTNSTTVSYDMNGARSGGLLSGGSVSVEHEGDAVLYEALIRFV